MSLPECISGYFNGCEMISHRNFDLDFPHNSAEHFFGYLFSICMSSLEIYLSPLTIKKICILLLSGMSSLYILDIKLSGRWLADIIFHSLGCFFLVLTVLFVEELLV